MWDAKRELEKRGYHVAGIYSGAWYWEHMPGGEPSMDGLGYLWVSHYGKRNATKPYRSAYADEGGDNHSGWAYPLGDRKPDILQYGSNGGVAGWNVDVNAFKGTREELAGIFTGTITKKEGPLMALTDDEQRRLLEKVDRIHHELTHEFQSRYPESSYRDTVVGFMLEMDRKIEDLHVNMLPMIWKKITGIFKGDSHAK